MEECPICRIEFDTEDGYEIHLLGHKLDNFAGIMERFIGWFERASQHHAEETEKLR